MLKNFLKSANQNVFHAFRSDQGFTLLEVVIAMAILVMAFASILSVENSSIQASTRAKQMNIVTMLAKNKMVETEFKFERKKFDEVKKEDEGVFEEPYQDYRWKTQIKELKWPSIASAPTSNSSNATGQDQTSELLSKAISNFLSKAIREVNVMVLWKKGGKEQKFTLSTFWVDLNYELKISE